MLAYAIAATIALQAVTQAQSEVSVPAERSATAAPPDTWGNAEVVDYLLTYGPDKTVPEDPFVASTPPPLPTAVVLTFPVKTQEDSRTSYWSYDRIARALTVTAMEDPIANAGSAPFPGGSIDDSLFIRGWALTESLGPRETRHVGWTSTEVSVDVYRLTGFGEVMRITNRGIVSPPPRTFQHTFAIDPEAARVLVNELEIRVIGKPRPWRGDERTLCVTDDLPAARHRFVTRSCYLTGDLETYQLVDRRDGSVLHEWDARSTEGQPAGQRSRRNPK